MTPDTMTYEQLTETSLRCLRETPWRAMDWAECPECGGGPIASKAEQMEDGWAVFDGEHAVCLECRRVWSWSVDEHCDGADAWLNDQREPDEDVPLVTVETLVAIATEVDRE